MSSCSIIRPNICWELDSVFAQITECLQPSGLVIFNHHNYYSWNGHHMAPKSVARIDPTDAEQQKYLDWAHVTHEPEPGSYIARGLNRIRLDDFRALVERHFQVIEWKEIRSKEANGLLRYNPEIAARYPAYSERELLTQHVLAVCRGK